MKSPRITLAARWFVTAAFAAALTMALASASWAQPATCAGPCASRAAFVVTARASHTDASARHVASSRAAGLRHHHRHALLANRSTGATTTRPQPLTPARQRPEHRAALPRVTARMRTQTGPREGQRALAALPGLPSHLTLAGGRLDPDQIHFIARTDGFIYAGRGPPRPGPFTSLPPSCAGGLPLLLLSAALWPLLLSGSSNASWSRGVSRAAPVRLAAASSYRFTPLLEPPPSCSYANRLEGAVVCFLMPSVGGFK